MLSQTPDDMVARGPMLGHSRETQMAIASPCLHLLTGNIMGVVVSFHRSHPSDSKRFNDAAFFETANFHSETFGVCCVVSGVILGLLPRGSGSANTGDFVLFHLGRIIFMAHVFYSSLDLSPVTWLTCSTGLSDSSETYSGRAQALRPVPFVLQ